jgi:hypothetical protein
MSRREAYRIYLKSAHWRHLRKDAFRHHGYKCSKCPCTYRLQVHHLTYRDPWEACTVADVVPICRPCHRKEHGLPERPVKPAKAQKAPKPPKAAPKPKKYPEGTRMWMGVPLVVLPTAHNVWYPGGKNKRKKKRHTGLDDPDIKKRLRAGKAYAGLLARGRL